MKVKSTIASKGEWLHFLCAHHRQPNHINQQATLTHHKCAVTGCKASAYSVWYKFQELNVPDEKSYDDFGAYF